MPITVRLALVSAMLALSNTERPASSVSAPLEPEPGVELIAPDTVMSLLAFKLTAVPALSKLTRSLDNSTLEFAALVANAPAAFTVSAMGPLRMRAIPSLLLAE